MSFSRQQRLVVAGGIVALVGWIVVLLLDDGSVLGILVRALPSHMGWASDSTAADVLRSMKKDEKKGHYDNAIKDGIAWTQKYPDAASNGWNGRIYADVSALYLKKAANDDEHAEEDVTEALLYRDKALPFSTDSLYWFRVRRRSFSDPAMCPVSKCDETSGSSEHSVDRRKGPGGSTIQTRPSGLRADEVCFRTSRYSSQSCERQA